MKKEVILGIFIVSLFVLGCVPVHEPLPENLTSEEKKDWIADKVYAGIYTHDLVDIDYSEPSQDDLDRLKEEINLTRKYPDKINALFEIGANTATLLHFSDELKDLGVNTYFVQAEINLEEGKPVIFEPPYSSPWMLSQKEAKRVIIHRMLMAKQEGFAVIFVPDIPGAFDGGIKDYDLDELEEEFEKLALEWAEISEEYQVEYLVPVNEYEKILESNDLPLDVVISRTNNFYERVIPKLREVYSGKIIIKTGFIEDWENHRKLSFENADLYGVGGCYKMEVRDIGRDINDMVRVNDEISSDIGVPWLITEFYVNTREDVNRDYGGDGVVASMEEAYEVGLAEFRNSSNAVGFTFTGYLGTGKIRGTEAVPILKEYYLE